MSKTSIFDSRVKVISVIVAIISTAFTVFTWLSSESKLSVKDSQIQNLAIELLINNKKINSLQDSIVSLEVDYNDLLAQKDSIILQSDSLRLVSSMFNSQIHDLYAKIDSLKPVPVNAPDSAQLRIFLQWTSE